MTHEEFAKVFILLDRAYGGKRSDETTLEVYYQVLRDFTAAEFEASAWRFLRSPREFMPAPGQIAHDIATASVALPDAEAAVAEVFALCRSVGSYGDPTKTASPLALATIEGYGWRAICDSPASNHSTLHAQLLVYARAFRVRIIEANNLGRIGIEPPAPLPQIGGVAS